MSTCRVPGAPMHKPCLYVATWAATYAQAVFVRCDLGGHILPAGWNNWGKVENEKTAFYAEYQSRGAGANPQARAPFSHQLHSLEGYAMEDVLAGTDGWNPMKNGNALLNIKR